MPVRLFSFCGATTGIYSARPIKKFIILNIGIITIIFDIMFIVGPYVKSREPGGRNGALDEKKPTLMRASLSIQYIGHWELNVLITSRSSEVSWPSGVKIVSTINL